MTQLRQLKRKAPNPASTEHSNDASRFFERIRRRLLGLTIILIVLWIVFVLAYFPVVETMDCSKMGGMGDVAKILLYLVPEVMTVGVILRAGLDEEGDYD